MHIFKESKELDSIATQLELNPRDFYVSDGVSLCLTDDFKMVLQQRADYKEWKYRDPLPNFSKTFPEVDELYETFECLGSCDYLDLRNWDVSGIVDMHTTFGFCSNLDTLLIDT